MTKARTLANFISDGSELADGTISVSEVSGAAPLASPTFTGTASGTFSGPLTGDVTGDLTGDVDLQAIAATISDTAVDIFVYDTRKDSDGGAWRKRTQHTSWYNETLNTATRGSRKEFPAVAVIVVYSDWLVIYDADDPDMPMWAKANKATFDSSFASNGSYTSVTALNGRIVCGNSAGTNFAGLWEFDFIADFVVGSRYSVYANDARGFHEVFCRNGELYSMSRGGIIQATVNDVAMTVLPNAPIDAATGLPVPTIAVATNGGVSVIKDDGTVVDSLSTSVYYSVMFNGSDLYAEDTTYADDTQYYGDAGSLSDSFPTFRNFYSYSPSYERLSSSTLSKFSGNILTKLGTPRSFAVGLAADTSTNASWTALNMVADHSGQNAFVARTALVSYINTSFNTGWMNGDIKLATLSDTDDTNVTGSELVTNGTFDTDTSGWTIGSTSTATIVSGKLEITSTSTSDRNVRQSLSVVAGKTYVFQVDSQTSPASGAARVRVGNTNGGYEYVDNIPSGTYTSYSYTFTPTQSTIWVSILPVTDGTTITRVDNISVRLAEEDRSVNGNGLQVFGTVTKSAVSSGADLVAYSGFSSSNYLQQPHNTDLDFGTGDFCVINWFNISGTEHTDFNSFYDNGYGGQEYFNVGLIHPDGTINFRTRDNGINNNLVSSHTSLDNGVWNCLVCLRRNGVKEMWVNGQLSGTQADTDNLTTGDPFRVGLRADGIRPVQGDLALLRISATAPSPEQIKKIYEDEKVLFQEGAQATLYGSSDAVTALAYDDSTELLHVGTSAGRSVFQGLKRVDNTTDAVGAAISASNGLVAED